MYKKAGIIFFVSLLILPVFMSEFTFSESLRNALFAGKFYPESQSELKDLVKTLENRTKINTEEYHGKELKALIMPHAGYRYSGLTASYATLLLDSIFLDKVIVMGTDHTTGFSGCAVNTAEAWETPLGRIPVHGDIEKLLNSTLFFRLVGNNRLKEHSVEVILPFLQYRLKNFHLVPMVMGSVNIEKTAESISSIIDGDTLIVASSDLSHYLPYHQAKKRDQKTIEMILNGDYHRFMARKNCACGKAPVAVLLKIAEKKNWEPFLLHYSNSGDTGGYRDRVVGYCAIAFFKSSNKRRTTQMSDKMTDKQGKTLLALARMTISRELGFKIDKEKEKNLKETLNAPVFNEKRGTFVTLHKDGKLRGCIGTLQASESIKESVIHNTINSAFHDPRFPPLEKEEIDAVDIEISLLTKPRRIEYSSAEELLDKITPGVDGVIIKKGMRTATFLPQVWDQIKRKEDFFSHLCRKASLHEEEWREGTLEVMTYQVHYFEEK